MKNRLVFSTLVAALLSVGCTPTQGGLASPASAPTILGTQFAKDLTEHDVVIIGETHGTQEIPQLIAQLSDQLGPRVLFALELRQESAEMTCPPGKIALSWQRAWADGRSSEAMLAALCKIRSNAENHDTELLLIDTRSATQSTFYDAAAATISERLDSGKIDNVIVLTGNYHSRKDGYHLAAALQALGKTAITATASTPTGTAWQCVKSGCGRREISLEFCHDPGLTKPGWTANFRKISGWDRCLTFPTLTASPPADQTGTN